jgi:anti-anti-sigma factor
MDIKTDIEERNIVFSPAGNLDLTASLSLDKLLNEKLNQNEGFDFIINMKDVVSLSSSCMSILIKTGKKLRKSNNEIRIINANQTVRELLSVANLDSVIPIYHNEEEDLNVPQ